MTTPPENTDGGSRAGADLALIDPGDINRATLAALAAKCPPEELAQKVHDLLHGTRMTKFGPEPDIRAQEVGLRLALAYLLGMPTQRQEIRTQQVPPDDVMDRLAKAPEARRAMSDYLRRVEDRARAVEAPPVEQKT